MRTLFLVGWALLVAACGNSESDPSESTGACAQRVGTYTLRLVAQPGSTCGDMADSVDNLSSEPTSPTAPCTGSISYADGNCTETYDETCPETLEGTSLATVHIAGDARFSDDGSMGTGTLQFTGYDSSGAIVCSGAYDLTDSRD